MVPFTFFVLFRFMPCVKPFFERTENDLCGLRTMLLGGRVVIHGRYSAVRAGHRPFASLSNACRVVRTSRIPLIGIMFGPSEGALSGS